MKGRGSGLMHHYDVAVSRDKGVMPVFPSEHVLIVRHACN